MLVFDIPVTASLQPGEAGEDTLAIFAGYLATHRDLILVAGRRIGPINLPRLRDLAPVFWRG